MLKGVKNLRFHIVGDGTHLENCKRIAETQGSTNVKFYGHLPLEEMPRMYSKADAMMVTGDNGVVSQTLPAKVQGYMAACKPIIGAIGGETARVIEKANCGFCGEALNAEQLKENILKFISTENKEVLGLNGYNFYEKNFRPEKFFADLTDALTRLAK